MNTKKLTILHYISKINYYLFIVIFLSWIIGWFMLAFNNHFLLCLSSIVSLLFKCFDEIINITTRKEVSKHVKYYLHEMKNNVSVATYEAFRDKYKLFIKYDKYSFTYNLYRLFIVYNHKIKKGL